MSKIKPVLAKPKLADRLAACSDKPTYHQTQPSTSLVEVVPKFACIIRNQAYLCCILRGARRNSGGAEIIPIEPDPGNAGEGRMYFFYLLTYPW